jgi:hypothetical protein
MPRRLFTLTMKDLIIAKMPKTRLDPMCQKEFKLYMDALRIAGMDSEKVPKFFEETLENAMEAAVSALRLSLADASTADDSD